MVPSHVLGVDLGGTQIRACRADRNGHILREARELTLAAEGPEAVLGRIKETLRDVLEGAAQGSVLGVGVACPGPLDPDTGVVLGPPNLPGWDNVPLRDIMQYNFNLPVFINNDANLAGLAEFHFGAGRGTSDLVYLTIGTGIGGGIIVGGRLLMGAHGLAGEPGHATVEPDGPRCNCGNVGCLESLSSGPSIARQAAEWIRQGYKSVLSQELQKGGRELTAEMVGKAALDGDEVALRAVARAAHYLGIGVLNLIHIFDPQMVVLGGGVSKLGELLFNPVRLWVRDHALTPVQRQTPIVPAGLGDRVGLLGAVAWAFERSGCQMSADT
jgi:glucokinase